MWREILWFLKSSLLSRALKFLEAALILLLTLVPSDRSWERYAPRYLNLFVNFTNLPEISSV